MYIQKLILNNAIHFLLKMYQWSVIKTIIINLYSALKKKKNVFHYTCIDV